MMGAYESIFDTARRTGPWTDVELNALRRHYPDGGAEQVLAQLPGRSKEAVYAMAQRQGLKAPVAAGIIAVEWADEIQREIAA